ncbi:MAG: DUF885 domain-containing protein [Cyclobacteriaceae bacterium]|nr:DUF885 domain-containing protein [Cyclobacteriaceae bacterium]
MRTKISWKKIILRSLLVIFILFAGFVINLIWFKPFSIRLFYDKIFVEFALTDPETVTQLGIPVLYGMSKDELTDVSDKKQWETFNQFKEDLEILKSYDFESQSPANQLNTQILQWFLTTQAESEPYFYHDYPVNQMFGVQNNLPSFLESAHKLRDASDADAYIARLSKFDTKFDQVLEGLKIRESKGIIPPRFVIDRVLSEMKGFTGQGKEKINLEEGQPNPIQTNILFANFKNKIDTLKDISDADKKELISRVEKEMQQTVFPAYQKLIDYFTALKEKATDDDGVWKFPDGDNFYKYQLKQNTTVSLNPEEIHNIGLSEVARIKKEMWEILKSEGYKDTTRSIGETVQAISKEERFLFSNDDAGRKLALAEYDRLLEEINSNLDSAFDIRPKSKLEVKRVPAFKEEGSAAAYYNGPPMDNSRGGTFYVNLRDLHEIVKFGMKTLAYHEGIPGHHFQIAIQSEIESVPMFRNILGTTAYAEGWALYSERLAWELGFYKNDPFGNLGRLQAEMFRSVRLVVDTGIHHKRWTRQQAIDYMVANTGMPTSEVTTEIERYVVMPGQACAYKIGMLKILELREKAKTALGEKFDLRKFHNAVLKNGSVPLELLEMIVDKYIQETKGA